MGDVYALSSSFDSILDLAFVIDCTGSMGSYIESVRNSIKFIVEEITKTENVDIKLALVEYRDHPPQEDTFVSRSHDFTSSVTEMKTWLDQCQAHGGGDAPEAVADGLFAALNLSWRTRSTKICILICDAPPHGLMKSGDSFPDGCPSGHDPVKIVKKMAERQVTLYSVGCEPALVPFKDFFSAIAYSTGGQYIPLSDANLLAKIIIGASQQEISLEKQMEAVQQEVEQQILNNNDKIDEDTLTNMVYEKLKTKEFDTVNKKASEYSKMDDLNSIKNEFNRGGSANVSVFGSFGSFHAPSSAIFGVTPSVTSNAKASEDISVEKEEIKLEQASRLVQKALQRRKNNTDNQKVENDTSSTIKSISTTSNKSKIDNFVKYHEELEGLLTNLLNQKWENVSISNDDQFTPLIDEACDSIEEQHILKMFQIVLILLKLIKRIQVRFSWVINNCSENKIIGSSVETTESIIDNGSSFNLKSSSRSSSFNSPESGETIRAHFDSIKVLFEKMRQIIANIKSTGWISDDNSLKLKYGALIEMVKKYEEIINESFMTDINDLIYFSTTLALNKVLLVESVSVKKTTTTLEAGPSIKMNFKN